MSDYLAYTDWLYTKIFENTCFFIDLWSLAHLWSGFVLFLVLKSITIKNTFTWLFLLLVLYELFEIYAAYTVLGIFKPETFKDQITDIIIGMLGGVSCFLMLHYVSKGNRQSYLFFRSMVYFFVGNTYAFLWVGFYGYQYNIEFFNSNGINWYAWMLWFIGINLTLLFFSSLTNHSIYKKLFLTWIIYLLALILVEIVGFHILKLQEVSKSNAVPLFFNLIHGTPLLHIAYLFSPFISIPLFVFLNILFNKALKESLV